MSKATHAGRLGVLIVLGIGAAEVLIMISPFAGFFYTTVNFDPFLGVLSSSFATAWLDGFFLNHSVVTRSALLEWNRTIGGALFTLGLWGFIISAAQVYGNKLRKRGVARGLLYRYVRHPQYLSLIVAGWGLLTIWPRFLLLATWVTMIFLYAALARFEENQMAERFGDDYRGFADTRGAFLPGSPFHRLFEATFGKLRPQVLGWAAAYVVCLTIAFSIGFGLRNYLRASSAVAFAPEHNTAIVSAWPQSEEWLRQVWETARSDERAQQRLSETRDDKPLVATILPPRYAMKGMFYKAEPDSNRRLTMAGFSPRRIGRLAGAFLLPFVFPLPKDFMGRDPDETDEPVQVVFSRAEKPYKDDLRLEEALDVSVRIKPLVVVSVLPSTGEVTDVLIPQPQNMWGPNVVMPQF